MIDNHQPFTTIIGARQVKLAGKFPRTRVGIYDPSINPKIYGERFVKLAP
jgi:hypothetical protein